MEINAELLIAVGSLITAVFLAFNNWRSSALTARKDEVALLREEVARLHDQQAEYEERISKLEDERRMLSDDLAVLWQYDVSLRTLMLGAGIQSVPEPPKLRSGLWGRRKDDRPADAPSPSTE